MAIRRKYPPAETLERMRAWCGIQERAHSEARSKLASWGVFGDEAESLIAELIGSNYLNEERFARAYASGKSRIKGWGWRKIEMNLKKKGVSAFSIRLAREEIDENQYHADLIKLVRKKWPTISGKSEFERSQKMFRFLAGKGFTTEEARKAMEEVGLSEI